MRILFALPGLHRVRRGAEVAFESVAQEIAAFGPHDVVLAGSGPPLGSRSYDYLQLSGVDRARFERWPKMPFLRSNFMYEELTFARSLTRNVPLDGFDLTVTCGFPYMNLALRKWGLPGPRPKHIFVTQNGDWPALRRGAEPRLFSCDGLICTNPIYFDRNRDRWKCALIPNGIDPDRFRPGPPQRTKFDLPPDMPIVLMVSALEEGKRVLEAVRAMGEVEGAFLLVAGDGPLRAEFDRLALELLPGRFRRALFAHEDMPDLYRSCDLFLHTTIRESFGNVYVEALSSGLPVLAHDGDVTRWILGDHAELVDTTVQDELVKAIVRELALGKSASPAAVDYARERFSWSVVASAYRDFFEQVVAED